MPRQIIRTFGLDRDTIAFAQRVRVGSGTTILPNNLIQLNKFVVGIKRMGIWNQMVCWPMRSTQNAGRGSTVYSLGGLGTFNGTMVNGPTWGSNGMFFSSALFQTVNPNISLTQIGNNFGLFTCADFSQLNGLNAVMSNRDIFNTGTPAGIAIGSTTTGSMRINIGTGTTNFTQTFTPPTGYECHSALSNGSNTTQNRNSTQIANNAPILNGPLPEFFNGPIGIGSQTNNVNFFNGRIAFASTFFGVVNNTLLYTLYRQTLGQNLGLPV
jgi:hypothetical protein